MFAIGEFARHGRVSVRMLRHYDAIGLLEPVRVDPATGYRFYDASQLSRLNRIVVLSRWPRSWTSRSARQSCAAC
jgi:DNA-binding transcriptional MerR regulator